MCEGPRDLLLRTAHGNGLQQAERLEGRLETQWRQEVGEFAGLVGWGGKLGK